MLGSVLVVGRFFLLFPFSTLNILCYSLLVCKVSAEMSAHSLVGVSLYMTNCFSPCCFVGFLFFSFKILFIGVYSLSLIFSTLDLGTDLFGFILFETVLSGPGCLFPCLPDQGSFSYFIFKYVLGPFISLFSFWDPFNVNVSMFDIVPTVS